MKTNFPRRTILSRLAGATAILWCLQSSPTLTAETYTWVGGAATNPNFYATAGHWTPAGGPPAAGDTAVFNDSAIITDNIFSGTNRTVASMVFEATKDFSLSSAVDRQFTFQSSLVQNGSGNVVFDALVSFSSAGVVSGTGTGAIIFNRNLIGNRALYIEGTGAFRVLVHGSQGATAGANTISNGASTIGGVGTLSRQLVVSGDGGAGATIDPGLDGGAGVFTLDGGLSSSVSSNFHFDLGGAGGTNDLLRIGGGVFSLGDPGAGQFKISLSDLGLGEIAVGAPISLIETVGGVTLDFAAFDPAAFAVGSLPEGWTLDETYGMNGIAFDASTGNLSIQFSAIPEGSPTMLFLVTLCAGIFWQKALASRS